MDISFIIVNWNTADLLFNCIKSIKDTISGYEYEIILVDNGSIDNSISLIKTKFPQTIIIPNTKNQGFSRAVNQGIKISNGDFVCLLNTDAVLMPGAVATLIGYLKENKKAGVCGGQLIFEDGRKQNSFDNYPNLFTELTNKSLLRILMPQRFPSKIKEYNLPINVESIIGACMMIKRECINKVGLLDENYFFFLEETDWCYRINRAGYDIVFVPSAKIVHLQGKSAKKVNIKSRMEFFYSRYLFFIKNRSKISFLILFVFNFIKCLVKSIVYSIFCLFTLFLYQKVKGKLLLSLNLVAGHVLFFPPKMRLEGNK